PYCKGIYCCLCFVCFFICSLHRLLRLLDICLGTVYLCFQFQNIFFHLCHCGLRLIRCTLGRRRIRLCCICRCLCRLGCCFRFICRRLSVVDSLIDIFGSRCPICML